MDDAYDLLAAAAFGIEKVAARQIEQLGYEPKIIGSGKILFRGTMADVAKTNLWLRTADRVLIRLGTFHADDFGLLFDGVRALPWEKFIPADGCFPVNGRSLKSQLSSVPACQKIVKKAIVERLLAEHNVTELPETGPRVTVEVAMLEDEAILTIDTTGSSLHKRGYRTLVGTAPLKETLAAAMIDLSYWKPGRPLIDPFCGSGTIPIEAALVARNIAPGLTREFDFESWPITPPELISDLRADARKAKLKKLERPLLGFDADADVLRLARQHANAAGVAHDVRFEQRDFRDLQNDDEYGCVITNPPYGERIGDPRELIELYKSFPHVLRRLPTWSHYVLTAESQFENLIGQRADRRRKIYNGRIECQLYQFYGPRPPKTQDAIASPAKPTSTPPTIADAWDEEEDDDAQVQSPKIAVKPSPRRKSPESEAASHTSTPSEVTEDDIAPGETPQIEVAADDGPPNEAPPRKSPPEPAFKPAFGGISAKGEEQAELFRNRLVKLQRHLRRWPKRGVHCYRLYERDIPEIPLVVDRYHDYLHIGEYERPHDRTPAQHAEWLDRMCDVAADSLELPRENVYGKTRVVQRGDQQHQRQDDRRLTINAEEGGFQFEVNMSDYVDTGLFLDHRIARGMVRDEAKGKHFLNLFCYTGAFSVYAAGGGAASTTSVDLSPTYVAWADRNLRRNGFRGNEHRLLQGDVMEWLRAPVDETYDLAVIDVPTFSNSKRTETVWDVQLDYIEALELLISRMSPEGVIYFSTNFRRFKFDESLFEGVSIREISKKTIPEDFRNKRIHRCWRMIVRP